MNIRTDIYQILSECYKEPCAEFAMDIAQEYLYWELSERLNRLGIAPDLKDLKMPGDAEDVLRALEDQYYPLFMGPFPPFVLPVESVHKAWARGEATPLIASEVQGMLMGDPAVDMLRRYKASGIEIPPPFKDRPDHLALLLEYMALLCENGTDEEQRWFIQDHLDWIPELKRVIHDCSKSRFYRTVADVTAAFVRFEHSELGKAGKYDLPLDQTVKHP